MGYKKGYKFFLTNTIKMVYTTSENGSAVVGYFDIVKWLRLLFSNNHHRFDSDYRLLF